MTQKGFVPIIVFIVILVLIGTIAAVYLVKQENKVVHPTQRLPTSFPTQQSTILPAKTSFGDWGANSKTYTNTIWNYQFQYPSTWILSDKDVEHVIVTSPDIEKFADGRVSKWPTHYLSINVVARKNIAIPLEEYAKSTYTEWPQCSTDSECPSSPPKVTKEINANSLDYYLITTGVYNNELAIFPLPKDQKTYVELNTILPLHTNGKLPDQMLSTFRFLGDKTRSTPLCDDCPIYSPPLCKENEQIVVSTPKVYFQKNGGTCYCHGQPVCTKTVDTTKN